ncbi:hypothetical protein J6590_063674 [Homalodisca vitripennis]|nr:hypothetical protein J6590_063674 [Homalodisca vitripennis]
MTRTAVQLLNDRATVGFNRRCLEASGNKSCARPYLPSPKRTRMHNPRWRPCVLGVLSVGRVEVIDLHNVCSVASSSFRSSRHQDGTESISDRPLNNLHYSTPT